jgi:CDP-diacylglycerol--glycerol-3-phosphate 3-phosphatidyltransferase
MGMSNHQEPITVAQTSSPNIPNWKRRLPMGLTLGRMFACPVLVGLVLMQSSLGNWLAALLFIGASITDWFDGYLARKYNATSNMGKFMDPIADKILVASALIMLIPSGTVNPILVLLLLSRDILIGGLRAVAAAENIIIDAKPTGKWKTGIQMLSIPAILIQTDLFGLPVALIGSTLLWISVALSIFSAIEYVQIYNRRTSSGL